MTNSDDLEAPTEKLQQVFFLAEQFTRHCFDGMIRQIETLDLPDADRATFTACVARSNLGTAADFLLALEDDPRTVGEIAAARVHARNQRKKAEKIRRLN